MHQTLPPLPMHQCPRCGARTRKGTLCKSPAVAGRKRCRMHGGADGVGAPVGNRNALKHGHYTAQAITQQRALVKLIRECQELLGERS